MAAKKKTPEQKKADLEAGRAERQRRNGVPKRKKPKTYNLLNILSRIEDGVPVSFGEFQALLKNEAMLKHVIDRPAPIQIIPSKNRSLPPSESGNQTRPAGKAPATRSETLDMR